MKLTGKTAKRYVSAVERETERTRLYTAMIKAQREYAKAKAKMDEASYSLRVARNILEDFEEKS